MKAYELMYFVAPSADGKNKETAQKRVEAVMKSTKTKIDGVDELGKQTLAYEINGNTEGDYTLVNFHSEPASIAEIDRVLRITDEIERHMIVARNDKN